MTYTVSDTIFDGRVVVEQSAEGYRFSIDSLLLVAFASTGKKSKFTIDLGAGCGVVGLGLLAAELSEKVVACEIQERLATLARRNGQHNGFGERYSVQHGDIRQLSQRKELALADVVVCNPPFWPVWQQRMPPDEERRIARHEVHGGLEDWIQAAKRMLHPKKGRFLVVYPAKRMDDLIVRLDQNGFSGTRLRLVHPISEKPAELVLIEARQGKTGRLLVEPPLLLKDATGNDRQDLLEIVSGGFSQEIRSRPDRRRALG